jgi:hypothetical protein
MLEPAWQLARRLERAKEFVPDAFVNRAEAIMSAILTGAELGRGPMWSLRSMHVINGRVGLSAEAMRALVLAAGHELSFTELEDDRVTATGRRKGSDASTSVTWTIRQAEKAGLLRNQVWKSYPRAMLTARATTELCRLIFADVVAGIATDEELADGYPLEAKPEQGLEPVRRSRGLPSSPPRQLEVNPPGAVPADGSPIDGSAPPLPGEAGYDLADEPAGKPREEEPLPLGSGTDDQADTDTVSEERDGSELERRRIFAAARDAFPNMPQRERETFRHALTALVTRERADGPTIHFGDLTDVERIHLSNRLVEIRTGAVLAAVEPDGTIVFSSPSRNAIVTPPATDTDRWSVRTENR